MTKNRTSYTHAARHAEWLADGGLRNADHAPELAALSALSAELIGQDTPEQIQARIASEGTVNGYRENCPELYGRDLDKGDASAYTLHTRTGGFADCELDEISRTVVASASHQGASADNGADEIFDAAE